MKKIISTGLTITYTTLFSLPTLAEINLEGQSILCQQQNWLTEIAFSTPNFNIAICIDKNDPDNEGNFELIATHYIQQSKNTNEKIILPLSTTGLYLGEPAIYKATTGTYTYQVYVSLVQKYSSECQCQAIVYDTVSLKIFNNGESIYQYTTQKFLYGWK
ncbi:hypothetical protein PCC7424_2532 [Gloeothece citriformis PCC 7424]|uniref:Uncharacterized protein n=1 Tax=Gloeothece citriformis (strain PCC 7424) TaxID=65393 RepID=B7KK64_GLOC7|nr:hypothetical protein [Gloeothece citriformis]ACK70949.1 hypothetical protein PCC7424_2532 [Gloeothece citriformis PCC 7424]